MELSKEQRVMQQVISKAWEDTSFKEALIANPLAAIKNLTGESVSIPSGKTLQVFDQSSPDVVCLNIPQKPDFSNVELTDDQLEAVAGGCIMWSDEYLPKWCQPGGPDGPGKPPVLYPLPPIFQTSNTKSGG